MSNPEPRREPFEEPTDGYDPEIVPRSDPASPRHRKTNGEQFEFGPREPTPPRDPAEEGYLRYGQPEKTSGLAVTSLILAILGIFIIPIILSSVAILAGWAAMASIDRNPGMAGKGIAIGGIVLGFVGLIIGILAVVVAASYDWLVFFLY